MRQYFYGTRGGSQMAADLKRLMKPKWDFRNVVVGKRDDGTEIYEYKKVMIGEPMTPRERHAFAWTRR